LRQAFLREAMQGKLCHAELVSASQETGQQLLEKIKAEKAQLIAEKKLKKEKELPPITADEIPFEIPEHWVWCRLGEITKVKVGSTPSRNEPKFWKGNIPWVSSGEVANNFIFDTRERITQEGLENTSLIIYPKGSVLVAMIGQGKTRGQTAILKIDATTNQNVAGMIIQHNYLISEYLWYFFLSRYETTRGGASGGNQPALNGIKISNTIFPLPPLHEQERIVAKLDELMAFCDGLEQSIKESQGYNEKLLQQVLREALQG
jgi:type I restriction enzyme S subunit